MKSAVSPLPLCSLLATAAAVDETPTRPKAAQRKALQQIFFSCCKAPGSCEPWREDSSSQLTNDLCATSSVKCDAAGIVVALDLSGEVQRALGQELCRATMRQCGVAFTRCHRKTSALIVMDLPGRREPAHRPERAPLQVSPWSARCQPRHLPPFLD